MNIKDKITIVIPCKNEEKYIGHTLKSIAEQNDIKGTRIIISDGNSKDKTRNVVRYYQSLYENLLNIELIDGGTVSYGRNAGSKLVTTKYILFIDADVKLTSKNIINKTLFEMYHYKLDLLTCKSTSYGKDIRTWLAFRMFNILNLYLSKTKPFAVGTYFLTKKDKFNEYGGFDETVDHSEDYLLSQKYDPNKFRISCNYIGQDDRKFKKMGYFGMIKFVIKSFLNRNNPNFFKEKTN